MNVDVFRPLEINIWDRNAPMTDGWVDCEPFLTYSDGSFAVQFTDRGGMNNWFNINLIGDIIGLEGRVGRVRNKEVKE